MGAAQFVLGDGYAAVARSLASFDELERVLVVCEVDGFAEDFSMTGEPRLLGFVAIRDRIRDTAPETMRYFVEQGVELRVISGDDPRTVSAIAARAGVPDADLCVDASTLDTDEKVHEASRRYRVFGRVTPQQKRELVRALHGAPFLPASPIPSRGIPSQPTCAGPPTSTSPASERSSR